MKLVFVPHGGRAAFKIGHVSALVGHDQRALELAGIFRIHAEIGAELHGATNALRDIDEGPVRKDGAVQRCEEIVRLRYDRAEIFLHQVRVLAERLGNRHKDHTRLLKLLAEGGGD